MTTNEKLIKNFWSNFINKDFDAISEIRNIADRENYTDKELKEINISFVFANILMPIKRRQLPDICYNAKTQKEIFKSGKYDNLLLDIENEATELRKIALHFLPPHIYIKVRDFTNFGKDYKRDLDIYIKENDCTEIDFLKEQIDFCKKQRETLKNIDLYRLFKVRVSKFEKRIKDIQHIQPIKTKADILKEQLSQYGFFELEKVKTLSEQSKVSIIEKIADSGLPYAIAMFDYLEFIPYLEKKHFDSKYKLNREVSKWFDSDKEGRAVKGNISSLLKNTTENKDRYTAYKHKENVIKDYELLK